MENRESGVSLSEIFKVIVKKIWLVILVAALFLAAAVFAVHFWYNRTTQTYSISYTIEFPGLENNEYPDGTPFRYNSVVSPSVLQSIVGSNDALSGIDVEKMVREDDIDLVLTSGANSAENSFTLTVGVGYFKNGSQAAAFMRAVAEYPVERAKSISQGIAADGYLSVFDNANAFQTKIDALSDQREYVLSRYDDMIAALSVEYTFNGRTLADYRAEAALVFDESAEEYLDALLATGHYVLDYEQYAESAQPRIDTIQKSIAENELRIAALVEQRDSATDSSYLESYNSRIAELTEENVDLRLQIEDIQASLDWINSDSRDADIADFTSRLNACRNLLASVTSTYKAVYSNYFDSISGVVYTTNKLTAQGGINVFAAAVAGAVVGAILAGIGICIKDLPSYMRQRRENASSENDQDVSAEQ